MNRDCYRNLPDRVKIVEVAPRDGWQNLPDFITTSTKVDLINGLLSCGFQEIEITSFVNPKAVPQLRDAAEVVAQCRCKNVETSVLVPNRRGLRAAQEAGAEKLVFFISASEPHNQSNLGCGQAQSLDEIDVMFHQAVQEHDCRVSISNVFGCPFLGRVEFAAVSGLVEDLYDIGLREITLCDTLGVANPSQVFEFCAELQNLFTDVDFGLHLHDSCGRALAGVIAGMQAGISRFDSAAGGLGGCPFALGAAGNLATEDLLYCLEAMGIVTGVDPETLLQMVRRQTSLIAAGNGHMLEFLGSCSPQ